MDKSGAIRKENNTWVGNNKCSPILVPTPACCLPFHNQEKNFQITSISICVANFSPSFSRYGYLFQQMSIGRLVLRPILLLLLFLFLAVILVVASSVVRLAAPHKIPCNVHYHHKPQTDDDLQRAQ